MTWTTTQLVGAALVGTGFASVLIFTVWLIVTSRHPAPPTEDSARRVQCGLCGHRTVPVAGDDLCRTCRNRCDSAVAQLTATTLGKDRHDTP